jgi:chemotaxis protein methyltransferase CheR
MAAPVGDDTVASVTGQLSRRTGLSFRGHRGAWLRTAVAGALDSASREEGEREALGPELLAQLCDVLTVQESFFFREQAKLDLVRHEVLPPLRAAPERTVRVWSAGCARGEEAYTLAALLVDAGLGARATVLGTDVSAAAVRAAEGATYSRWSLRGLDDDVIARCFTIERAGWRVREHLRAPVRFRQHNLLDDPPEAEGFDLVLCRNVLIYLTPEAVGQVARRLLSALVPGGWLVTSSSDPLLHGVEGLEVVVTPHGVAYRRPLAAAAALQPALPESPMAVPRGRVVSGRATVPAPDAGQQLDAAERALDLGDPRTAQRLAEDVLAADPSARAHALVIRALGEQGRVREAVLLAARAVQAHPLDTDSRLLQAVLLLETDAVAAAAAARQAVYLDPRHPLGHALLARCHEALGDDRGAARARRSAARLLADQEPA